jgi:Txe/YoeB family toxin of Txe-Axe toxin-antitoxin module
MTDTERNYEIYDKELLAVMTALSEWRHFLLGSTHDFEVWNDHKNLEYFRKPHKLNRRQARWVTELADYHYTLHHKPGKQMAKADLLSRRADHDHRKSDNTNVTLLKAEHFRANHFSLEGLDQTIVDQIKACHDSQDTAVVKAITNKEKGWTDDGEITAWEHRLYVPRSA